MKEVQLKVERTKQQRKAWEALAEPIVRRLLYGGAKGGGKSWFLCVWIFAMVWQIMVEAKLKPSKNPPHVAWFGRKQATDLTGTTLQTWREVIPEEYYKLRGATERDPKHILIADRIAIDYGGLDKQEHINKFNSAEYIIIAIDQAEEVNKDEIAVLRGSLRMVLKGAGGKVLNIPFKELYTANPRQCWLKTDFISNPKPNARYIPALPTDNPYLPGDYLQTLEDAFGHRPELLRAYKEGDWNAIEGAEQVIKDSWLAEAEGRICRWPIVKRFLVCDPARFGDDECVIIEMENTEILQKVILPYCRTTEISSRLGQMSNSAGKIPIVVESIGADLGAGVIDELVGMGFNVIQYNPAGASTEPEKYANSRAEAWSVTAKALCDGVIDKVTNCPFVLKNIYDELRNQLCTPSYKFRNTKILIESKEDIKARLGRSPDHADCYVAGIWALPSIPEVSNSDWDRRHRFEREKSPMLM